MPRLPLLALILLAGPASAADPKPNTLTPKQVGDGWLLLFDGESTFGWKIDGAAEVEDGVLVLGKGKKTVAYPVGKFGGILMQMEWRGRADVYFPDFVSGFRLSLRENERFVAPNFWGYLRCITDTVSTGYSHTGPVTKANLKEQRPEFQVAPFVIETDGKTEFRIRSVSLKPEDKPPHGAKPLFNGKDLSGWKLFAGDPKRMASKAGVTPAGELSLKNGPGDLQTEAEFADFVLQLECKTNGKGLNSGVFFRCLPGQYQQGYEAQIQNSYLGDDRTKPLDFGTGAIYRRVPARKVVSDDGEWFTLTVAANGPRISTWVNGYPTVSWTDDRKPAESARQGLRTGKGHISLQGHDPTTDLLFRNIRLAEIKKD